ncbi:RNA polymerase III RPC4-domain-containing protein [Myxozyma melibiosi]|uniref:RNA polymerase III RPC4-domain-containing protein n=1 Tax=Myxozyma melibiosi TaxID=54550 RepID=A0ABR1F6E6_9ASCO
MPPKRNLPPPKPPTTGRRAIPQDQTQQSTPAAPSATTTTTAATPAPSSVGSSFPALSALPPSRLDSLSRPRALSASPGSSGSPGGSSSLGLKFKPKLVARRPKEEREAAAPTVAPPILPVEPSSRGRGRGGRGGFGGRGGRGGGAGRGKMEPVASIASGPFADPVFGDPRASRAAAFERRAPAEYGGASGSGSSERSIGLIAALAAKERKGTPEANAGHAGAGSGTGGSAAAQADDYESDDEAVRQGFERINIAKVGKLTDDDAQGYARYFPIREDSGGANAEDEYANDEQIDDALVQEREQSEFVDVFGEWDLSQLERKLYFFQFAPVLPVVSGVKADDAVKDEHEQSADSATSTGGKAKAAKAKPAAAASGIGAQAAEGQVGKLVVRKSGKISIVYGGIEMDIAKGARTQFLQDVVVVDDTPEAEQATLLGQITGKVVVTPSIEKLLESDGDESD